MEVAVRGSSKHEQPIGRTCVWALVRDGLGSTRPLGELAEVVRERLLHAGRTGRRSAGLVTAGGKEKAQSRVTGREERSVKGVGTGVGTDTTPPTRESRSGGPPKAEAWASSCGALQPNVSYRSSIQSGLRKASRMKYISKKRNSAPGVEAMHPDSPSFRRLGEP